MKYKQGDILTYNNRYRKILGVCGEVYFMSYESEDVEGENLNRHFDVYTQYDLDRYGYKLCRALKAYPDIEPVEELYYIEMFIRDDSYGYLRYDEDEDRWSIGSLVTTLKCKFTMQEIKGWGEEQDNDFTQFAVKVEEK